MNKRALITGITGQDGSYLAEHLLNEGYDVFGLTRRTSTPNDSRISHILDRIHLYEGDLLDEFSVREAVWDCEPNEVYNLAAQSFVGTSWKQPIATSDITGLGALRVLNAVKELAQCSTTTTPRFYQASSSEMFGKVHETPQTESTRFHPRSPYGTAKAFAHYATVNYRESYDLYACSGILFNHESPRRGLEFVTRKITRGVAEISSGVREYLPLGNLDAQRDWGDARDYVRGMHLMLQQEAPQDYVLATGQTRTIRDLLDTAFDVVGITDWEAYIKYDPRLFRPAEVDLLLGDSFKARTELGWQQEISFERMINDMVQTDLETLPLSSWNS